ncbi:MAG: hypothetical protein M3R45_14010 [Pseudomonadota bacterium]|nr:hypothetical protein [Pseudomonadota bacterium]
MSSLALPGAAWTLQAHKAAMVMTRVGLKIRMALSILEADGLSGTGFALICNAFIQGCYKFVEPPVVKPVDSGTTL